MDRQRAHDRVISRLAARQHGVVARAQLIAAGIPGYVIDHRMRTGALVVVHRGVYAVGHAQLRPEGWWLAAALAFGPAAVVSHATAAALWGIHEGPVRPVHVLVPARGGRRRRSGIVVHRADGVQAGEVAERHGIPVTSVARTIVDLAATVRGRSLEQVVRAASRRRLFDLREQRRVAERHARHPGAPELRRLLAALEGVGTADFRSRMEVGFAQLCDDHGLPRPVVNGRVLGELVDFHWPGSTLVVEADSFEFHSMPTTFAADRLRDQRLTAAGYTVLRVTYDQVVADAARTAALVGTMLSRCWAR